MVDLRIVDAPEIPTENITGEEKLPTGGSGNYSITLDSVADYTKTKKDLADNTSVDGKVNGVRQELNIHIEDSLNPHQVTKGQIGLGNVDNTADADKPVSNSAQAAIISAVSPKADKTYVDNQLTLKANKADVYTKLETYTKQESSDLVNNSISAALTPINSSLDLAKRGTANRYDPSLTYDSGERVVITNGDIVRSTIDGNANNPNVDMTGWEKPQASEIFDESGKTQQQVNDEFNLLESSAMTIPDNARAGALGGALRVASNGAPFIINDANHLGFGLTGAEVGATQYDLKIKYEHGFSKVGSLVATVDETLAAYMLSIGGSVGQNFADLKIVAPLYFTMLGNVISGISPLWADYVAVADSSANHVTLTTPTKADSFMQPQITSKNNSANTRIYTDFTAYSTPTALKISAWKQDKASCRIVYNGTGFVVSASNISGVSATFAGNQITITHPPALSSNAISGRIAQPFASNYRYVLAGITSTTTMLYVYDAAGVALTTMDTTVSFAFEFSALDQVTTLANIADREISVFAGYYYVPIAALGKIAGGNLWLSGAMIK